MNMRAAVALRTDVSGARLRDQLLMAVLAVSCAVHTWAAAAPAHFNFPGVGTISVYRGAAPATGVVLLVPDGASATAGIQQRAIAAALVDQGALVASINSAEWLSVVQASPLRCQSLAGYLERLSHGLQKRVGLRNYRVPVLVGDGAGAALVYAALVQAPVGTFGGAIGLNFCPDLPLANARLCSNSGAALHTRADGQRRVLLQPAPMLQEPWVSMQVPGRQRCPAFSATRFADGMNSASIEQLSNIEFGFGGVQAWQRRLSVAYQRINAGAEPVAVKTPGVTDLPLTELPVANADGALTSNNTFAVMLSGDGGWAGLDQDLAAELNRRGIPVVGFSSLRYFWSAQPPDHAARDINRIISHYAQAWHRSRVLLIGYSFGADVLPFIVERLPGATRAQVDSVSLLGLSSAADFEVHFSGWMPGDDKGEFPIAPVLRRMHDQKVLCVLGKGETTSACRLPLGPTVEIAEVGEGHRFSNDVRTLVTRILRRTQRPLTVIDGGR